MQNEKQKVEDSKKKKEKTNRIEIENLCLALLNKFIFKDRELLKLKIRKASCVILNVFGCFAI